jgi:5'-nucleotidase
MNSERPLALLTNDDGINSNFLRVLIEEFSQLLEVIFCAPDQEKSWIGHAISRHQKLKPENRSKDFNCEVFSLNGTPADCVNFAIGNLLPREPDLVISGINLGYNVTLPMILSSGTVGAALEASLLGIPAFAVSMALPEKSFEEIRKNMGKVDGKISKSLRNSAKTSAYYAKEWIKFPSTKGLSVHNLNFPCDFDGKDEPILSFAGTLKLGNLFPKVKNQDYHQLEYRPEWLKQKEPEIGSDLWVLNQGKPTVSRLDFADISGRKHLEP